MLETQAVSLAAARDALLELPHPFVRDAVHSAVAGLSLCPEELEPYLNFSDEGYTRTLFYRGPRFEILVILINGLILLPLVVIPPTTGVGNLALNIPPDPALVGQTVYVQALIVNQTDPSDVHLTGYTADLIGK